MDGKLSCYCVKLFDAHYKKLAYRLLKRLRHYSREDHYYSEDSEGLVEITDVAHQARIEDYRKKHRGYFPDGTTCESGYAALEFAAASDVCINPSLVEKHSVAGSSTATIVARLTDGPKLPVSCIAAVEQVVALQDKVTDFVSDLEPSSKKQVMYQILLRTRAILYDEVEERERMLAALIKEDAAHLTKEDVSIAFVPSSGLFSIEVSSQKGDIQKIIKGLNKLRYYSIVDVDFKDVHLNEGICFVKSDASNPIHAVVNVADTASEKGFLERDAGATSGAHTALYQDNFWTLNKFRSLEEIHKHRGHESPYVAVKMYLKPAC